MKRAIDLSAAAVLLVVLSPLLIIAAIAIRLDSPGPILFRHERVGCGFQPFPVLKFRTMVNHVGGPALTVGGDARVTRVGHVLRRLKIDELPQLVNVLRGEMSLVGPRPEAAEYVSLFEADFRQILTVRPGMTGLASVEYADEERILAAADDPHRAYVDLVLPHKIELAKQYVQSQSVLLDLRILLNTLLVVVRPRGPGRRPPLFRG